MTRTAILLTLIAAALVACEPSFAAADVAGKVAAAVSNEADRVHTRINNLDIAQLVQGFIIVSLGVYTFIANRHQATQNKVDALEQRMMDKTEAHGERLSRVEQALGSLATHRDLNAISTNMASVASQMDGLIESQKVMRDYIESSLRPLARMQDMLTQHQLDAGAVPKTTTRRRKTT